MKWELKVAQKANMKKFSDENTANCSRNNFPYFRKKSAKRRRKR